MGSKKARKSEGGEGKKRSRGVLGEKKQRMVLEPGKRWEWEMLNLPPLQVLALVLRSSPAPVQ